MKHLSTPPLDRSETKQSEFHSGLGGQTSRTPLIWYRDDPHEYPNPRRNTGPEYR